MMLGSKFWYCQAVMVDRAKTFMSILTIASLFIDQISKLFLPKWSAKRALQRIKGENILCFGGG